MPFAFSSVVWTAAGLFLSAGQCCPPRWEQPAPRSILSRKACKGNSALLFLVNYRSNTKTAFGAWKPTTVWIKKIFFLFYFHETFLVVLTFIAKNTWDVIYFFKLCCHIRNGELKPIVLITNHLILYQRPALVMITYKFILVI